VLISATWGFTPQVGVTVDVELSLQFAVAVYVVVPYSGIDDGPSMERPVRSPLLPPPSPPPPPHVRTVNARSVKSIEAGRYVLKNFLISIPLSATLSID
jgi:hypothetical protein